MKNVVNVLQAAVASVVAQRPAQRRRFDPRLDLADPPFEARRLPMNGILQSLDELLQMHDAGLERPDLSLINAGRGRRRWLGRLGRSTTNLADAPDQPLTVAHTSPASSSTYRGRARRVAAAFLVSHPADHQCAALDLFADHFELLRPLFLGPLACALHALAPEGRTVARRGPSAAG
jgi:hypothetical protein